MSRYRRFWLNWLGEIPCWRQARMTRPHLDGKGWGIWSDIKGGADSGHADLTRFFLKLVFTRKGTGGLKRRLRSLTQVWSSKGSLSTACSPCLVFLLTGGTLHSILLEGKKYETLNFIFVLSFHFIFSRDRVIYLGSEFGIKNWKWWMGAFWPLLLFRLWTVCSPSQSKLESCLGGMRQGK